MTNNDKIQVEIWSDVMCPFCYMGKRQFEQALEAFPGKDRVEVTWRSYMLDPGLEARAGESVYQYLARRKGMGVEQSRLMHRQVADRARTVGLDYDFDKLVVANSQAAHRLIQGAKAAGRGDAMEEALFRAYFTEGRDIADRETLRVLAQEAGLDASVAEETWTDPEGAWGRKVEEEAAEAAALGCTGVPFFVVDRRFAVAGAQGRDAFIRMLEEVAAKA